ncbi:MAG: sulfite exporter TauE/SafE family protein [Treponema sp.]|jgi:sulfite exporter TauE/SafE/copper chaperone CopZ/plastocyanin domain-containing protein|nr:sulfite exporter TauE/SafE family protein [Treponema sp.]
MEKETIHIDGMTCVNCQNRIEKKLKSTVGIDDAEVHFNTGTATVTYNADVVAFSEIKDAIEQLDYKVLNAAAARRGAPVSEIVGTLVIILSLYVLLQGAGIGSLTSAFPLAEAGMSYGMLFIIGLITSVHCAAMCGGINLSQCIPAAPHASDGRGKGRNVLLPSLLYNAGRVVSYTAAGTIVGAVGQAFTVSGRFQGAVQLAAGTFMVIMGINMLGMFPWLRRFNPRLPKVFARKIDEQKTANKSPLIIGLLNGFMPCGPLQAMQLYALSTGSPLAGGIAMFLFSMGTVPLMFGIGALSSILIKVSGRRALVHQVMKGGAVLVTVMGMTMFTYGSSLLGLNFDFADRLAAVIQPFASKTSAERSAARPFTPVIENGVQVVNSTLSGGRYPAITVYAGIPVKWTINAPQGSINGCNNRMIIREYRIEHRFTPGENVIEFTPDKTGRFSYSCWMGMIRSSITVVEEGQNAQDIAEPDTAPSPAGAAIPTDTVRIAERQENGSQTVTVNLRDDGIEPAIIVVQRGLPAVWTINNDSLDPGNTRLIFPAYFTELDMKQGDNVIRLMPTEDFDFSTGDNIFYGYVKVVEDLNAVDIGAIKTEVSEFETLIYPDAYFEAASQAAGCCG